MVRKAFQKIWKRLQEKKISFLVPSTAPLEEVCVLPLKHTVLFPGITAPLQLSPEQYKSVTGEIMKLDLPMAMSLTRKTSEGQWHPSTICGGGSIRTSEGFEGGKNYLLIEGQQRLRIVRYLQHEPYLRALAEVVPDIPFFSASEERTYAEEFSILAKRWIFLSSDFQDQMIDYVNLFPKPHELADFIGFYFLPTVEEKQKLLEMIDRKKRVEYMMEFIKNRIHVLEKSDYSHLLTTDSTRHYH